MGDIGENQPQRRCLDWMIVSGTCHFAKDRSAFQTYRGVGTSVRNFIIKDQTIFVAGVGTVELRVRSSKEEGSPDRVLVMENVLHIPSAICNGFNWAVYRAINGGHVNLELEFNGCDSDGRPLWCGQPYVGLQKLVLAGNPQGESYLKEGGHYCLSIYVSNDDLRAIQAAAA
jgi:hypothetical protein